MILKHEPSEAARTLIGFIFDIFKVSKKMLNKREPQVLKTPSLANFAHEELFVMCPDRSL